MRILGSLICLALWFCPISPAWASWSPDYLIIGAQKSGTTTLNILLNQHPDVCGHMREVHFFDTNFEKGEKWYKRQLKAKRRDKHCLTGDKTPKYIYDRSVPEKVHQLYPDVKLILILRNPVDRAYSHYWFYVRNGKESLPVEEALFTYPTYLSRSRYAEQIKRWYAFFPKEQMLILDSNDLRHYPQETMQTVFSFLGLPEFTVTVLEPEKKSDYPPIDPELRKTLVEYFKPYNEELETLLDRKFNWN